ncbi:MAG: nucleoside monophosphate kinase [Candidatus Campbellbacteria bacterium]|nr:nucleoside monophosphate kinase [Candidatus Campbellbacteria bacterium]
MDLQTFIILGSSGSGKGTQTRMLNQYLEEVDKERGVIELVMGDNLRELWRRQGYTEERSKELMELGKLQPSFLQIYTWTQFFIDNLEGNEHLIVDGTPRRIEDAIAMDSAFRFYERPKPKFIFLDISREEAKKRLLERSAQSKNKTDLRSIEDEEEKIESRLDWFEEFVLPAVDFFKNNPDYKFINIDGELPVEEVHRSIIKKAFEDDL